MVGNTFCPPLKPNWENGQMADFDPERDLSIDRVIRATPEAIWRCWAEPDLFKRWFTPPPVKVVEVDNDLRPGGRAYTVMKLPDGTLIPSDGCFILADPNRRLVFTDALMRGFRPAPAPFFTADIQLAPVEAGTRYAVHVMHSDADSRKRHEEMGFHDGWNTTITQLQDLARTL